MTILLIHLLRWMRSPTLWRTLQGTPLCQGQMRDLAQSAGTGKPSSFRWLPYPLKSQRHSHHVCNIPVWHQESGSRDEAVLCVHQPELPPQMDWVKISTLDFANIATNQLSPQSPQSTVFSKQIISNDLANYATMWAIWEKFALTWHLFGHVQRENLEELACWWIWILMFSNKLCFWYLMFSSVRKK